MKYLAIIIIFVLVSCGQDVKKDEYDSAIHRVDSIQKHYWEKYTDSVKTDSVFVVIDTIKIEKEAEAFPIENDSLINTYFNEYKGFVIVQKIYESTKYEGVPYCVITIVSEKTTSFPIWKDVTYASDCKLNYVKQLYYKAAKLFIDMK